MREHEDSTFDFHEPSHVVGSSKEVICLSERPSAETEVGEGVVGDSPPLETVEELVVQALDSATGERRWKGKGKEVGEVAADAGEAREEPSLFLPEQAPADLAQISAAEVPRRQHKGKRSRK